MGNNTPQVKAAVIYSALTTAFSSSITIPVKVVAECAKNWVTSLYLYGTTSFLLYTGVYYATI